MTACSHNGQHRAPDMNYCYVGRNKLAFVCLLCVEHWLHIKDEHSLWVWEVKPTWKSFKPAFFLTADQGGDSFSCKKEARLCSLWENDPNSLLICYFRTHFSMSLNEFMVLIASLNTAWCSFGPICFHLEYNKWQIRALSQISYSLHLLVLKRLRWWRPNAKLKTSKWWSTNLWVSIYSVYGV